MGEDQVERRLAAILAADVVGYSRLMGLDEGGTLSAFKAHRRELVDAKIAEHQGTDRQAHRRRHAGRVPERGERRGLRRRHPAEMRERNADVPATGASSFASASISATSSSRTTTSSATASTSRRGSKGSPSRAALPSRARSGTSRQQARRRLRGHRRAELKNIERPVRVFDVSLPADGARRQPHGPGPSRRHGATTSIAVLPFNNMSGDPSRNISPTASPKTSSPTCPRSPD